MKCKDCVCSDVCYYKAFNDVRHVKRRDDVEKVCKSFVNRDAVEVVHGRWVDHMVRDWRCSECGEKIHKVRSVDGYCYDDKPNYCPNCGADMRERKDND